MVVACHKLRDISVRTAIPQLELRDCDRRSPVNLMFFFYKTLLMLQVTAKTLKCTSKHIPEMPRPLFRISSVFVACQ